MKNIFKMISFISVILIVTGCTTNVLNKTYNKIQPNEKGISGYNLDLRIYGVINNSKVSEVVKITNYMNKDFKITRTIIGNSADSLKPIKKEETTYVFSDTIYALNNLNKYVVTDENIKYSQPDLYMAGLKSARVVGKKKSVTIGEKKYDLYKVTFEKKPVENMLANTMINDIKVPKIVEGEVYIDSDGYLYRIKYIVDTITINANYFGIDTISKINLPN